MTCDRHWAISGRTSAGVITACAELYVSGIMYNLFSILLWSSVTQQVTEAVALLHSIIANMRFM